MSNPDQKGRLDPRLMLGPLRFANHDCQPNAQSIKNSHAYFFPEGCGCKTCNPCNPPEAPRHRVIEGNFAKKEIVTGGKRTRRGGRRRNPKKQRMESQEKKDGEPEESL